MRGLAGFLILGAGLAPADTQPGHSAAGAPPTAERDGGHRAARAHRCLDAGGPAWPVPAQSRHRTRPLDHRNARRRLIVRPVPAQRRHETAGGGPVIRVSGPPGQSAVPIAASEWTACEASARTGLVEIILADNQSAGRAGNFRTSRPAPRSGLSNISQMDAGNCLTPSWRTRATASASVATEMFWSFRWPVKVTANDIEGGTSVLGPASSPRRGGQPGAGADRRPILTV
jgi:hypothetical protein